MNTILVWVLVTFGGASSSTLVYSPPLPDLAICEHLQQRLSETRRQFNMRCVQLRMVVTK